MRFLISSYRAQWLRRLICVAFLFLPRMLYHRRHRLLSYCNVNYQCFASNIGWLYLDNLISDSNAFILFSSSFCFCLCCFSIWSMSFFSFNSCSCIFIANCWSYTFYSLFSVYLIVLGDIFPLTGFLYK